MSFPSFLLTCSGAFGICFCRFGDARLRRSSPVMDTSGCYLFLRRIRDAPTVRSSVWRGLRESLWMSTVDMVTYAGMGRKRKVKGFCCMLGHDGRQIYITGF